MTIGGAAGMFAFEKDVPGGGFDSFTTALWWTAMMITTIGSEYWPKSADGVGRDEKDDTGRESDKLRAEMKALREELALMRNAQREGQASSRGARGFATMSNVKADLVAIVASRRGVSALRQLLSHLPATFEAPIVCLVESDPGLAELLQSYSRLRVRWAEPGQKLEKHTVYLSPPERSLVLRPDDTVSITPFGVGSSGLEPVDYFLSSAARHGPGLLTLVLAGFESHGVEGCKAVRERGGTVLVLDRATARYWGMAEAVVRAGASDRVLTMSELAEAMRACFPSADILRCAEIQIEVGSLLETALRISGTTMGMVSRLEGDHLSLLVERGLALESVERLDALPARPDTLVARALLERSRVVIRDVHSTEEPGVIEVARAVGFRALHAVPLLHAPAQPRGVLATLFAQPHDVVPAEARDMDELAGRITPIIARLP